MSYATIAFGAIEDAQGLISFESGPMSTRRMAYWWFWAVSPDLPDAAARQAPLT
jgi:hypothetical protein